MTAPARGSWARAVAIRGDATQVGIALWLGVALLAAAAVSGALAPAVAAGGAAGAGLAGLALVRWNRAAWRGLLVEVATAHRDDDPGDSPVPWVSDAVWRGRNRFDPELDAPAVLAAEVDRTLRPFDREVRGEAVREPTLRPVSDAERDLAPAGEPLAEGAWPPLGDADALRALLTSTPGRFLMTSPRWPVCHGRLSVLIGLRDADRPADATWLPPVVADVEAEPVGPRGQHSFRCAVCGRAWATDPAW
jgi:hypothetical protein